MFSFLTVFKVINLQDRPLQNKDFIHRGLGGPRLASVCWEQTDDVETTASRFHNYCALRSYVLQLILWTESVWFVPCWFQYHQINYNSLKENFAWTESLSMFDCGAPVCRANSISIHYRLTQTHASTEEWTRGIMASPPMNHHLRLTRVCRDYCPSIWADEQLWVWKQRHFFISFIVYLRIKKQTSSGRAVMQCVNVCVCMETLCWKAHSSAEN